MGRMAGLDELVPVKLLVSLALIKHPYYCSRPATAFGRGQDLGRGSLCFWPPFAPGPLICEEDWRGPDSNHSLCPVQHLEPVGQVVTVTWVLSWLKSGPRWPPGLGPPCPKLVLPKYSLAEKKGAAPQGRRAAAQLGHPMDIPLPV